MEIKVNEFDRMIEVSVIMAFRRANGMWKGSGKE